MKQTDYATGKRVAPTPDCAGDLISYRAEYSLLTGDETLNNIIEMGPLPADCTLVDAILDVDDLDSNGSPSITVDVGVMSGQVGALLDDSGNPRTCDASIISAATIAQTGGVVRPNIASAFRIARVSTDTSIGVKIHAAPGTAAAGKVGLTLIYRG